MAEFTVDDIARKKRLAAYQKKKQPAAVPEDVSDEPVTSDGVPEEPDPIVEHEFVEEAVSGPQKPRRDVYGKPKGRLPSNKESFIKSLPEGAVAIARQMFPEAKNNKDAVAAYIYFKSLKGYDAPEHIRDMVRAHESDDATYESLSAQITNLSERLEGHSLAMSEIELAVAYLIFDRLGFRKGSVNSVDGLDFLENGMDGLLTRLRTTAIQKRNHEGHRKRPMRELK
ncbi:MAG: hypothetical protein HDQ88_08325 [Clostridia bacterium]|nr:hypothetical protein [Clostridia bacterium]